MFREYYAPYALLVTLKHVMRSFFFSFIKRVFRGWHREYYIVPYYYYETGPVVAHHHHSNDHLAPRVCRAHSRTKGVGGDRLTSHQHALHPVRTIVLFGKIPYHAPRNSAIPSNAGLSLLLSVEIGSKQACNILIAIVDSPACCFCFSEGGHHPWQTVTRDGWHGKGSGTHTSRVQCQTRENARAVSFVALSEKAVNPTDAHTCVEFGIDPTLPCAKNPSWCDIHFARKRTQERKVQAWPQERRRLLSSDKSLGQTMSVTMQTKYEKEVRLSEAAKHTETGNAAL
eukprot:scaffold11998_cov174-Amphora_coffeaeformis.AAC.17